MPLQAPGDLPVLRAERAYRYDLACDAASPPSRTAHRTRNHAWGTDREREEGEAECIEMKQKKNPRVDRGVKSPGRVPENAEFNT